MSGASRAVSRNEKSLGILSKQYSSKDLPSHTKLKYRQTGQNTSDELKKRDFKRELHDRERASHAEKESKKAYNAPSVPAIVSSSSSTSKTGQLALPSNKKLKTETVLPLNIDADDPINYVDDEDNNDTESEVDSDDDDSEEDDMQKLLAELNCIKNERAIEEAKREAEQKAKEEQIRIENILHGNPLTSGNKGDFKVKRRWDDDVVFKNCSRADIDEKEKPFINDTLRSEFHKKFMEKYIK